jgi:uncharacterized membrane protein YdcZ (DUF606 family)
MSDLVVRLFTLLVGGYALMVGVVALAGVVLPRLGVAASEAVLVAAMLAFPLFCGVIIWGYHHRPLARVVTIIAGGSAVSIGAALWLAPSSLA